jgi:hypothetical protein
MQNIPTPQQRLGAACQPESLLQTLPETFRDADVVPDLPFYRPTIPACSATAVFPAPDDASHINGQTIRVDGGFAAAGLYVKNLQRLSPTFSTRLRPLQPIIRAP